MTKIESFGIIPFIKQKEGWKVLLILHKEGNHWGFPKGKANEKESALEAAKRELKEETGLSVVKVFLEKPLVEQYQFRRKKELVIKTVYYFPAEVTGDLSLQEEEIRDAKWVLPSESIKHLTFKEAQRIFSECLSLIDLT